MNDDVWLVVGLGNPGPRYSVTRHNAGQMVVDELAGRVGARFKRHRSNAQVAEGRAGPARLVLAKPNTFMNVSGPPVASLARFYSLDSSHVLVVHDELDLPFDTVRLKQGGGHGGHNGLRDIIAALGSPDFVRIRVGVGRPSGHGDAVDHVLSPFTATERQNLPALVSDAAEAVETIVADGLLAAQQRFHAPRA